MTDDELRASYRAKARLRLPLTAEEAALAWDDAPEVPVSEERLKEIVDQATGSTTTGQR